MFTNSSRQARSAARYHAVHIKNELARCKEFGLVLEVLFTEQLANEQRGTLRARQEQMLDWVAHSLELQTALSERRALELAPGAKICRGELNQLASDGRKRKAPSTPESDPGQHTCLLHSAWVKIPENIADPQFDFASAFDEIEQRLPSLTRFILSLMKNTRKDTMSDYRQRFSEQEKKQIEEGKHTEEELVQQLQTRDEMARKGPALMVVAIIAGQFSPMSTRGVQHMIAFYLQSRGVRRNVISFLNDMGVCSSWDRINEVQGPLIQHALVRMYIYGLYLLIYPNYCIATTST